MSDNVEVTVEPNPATNDAAFPHICKDASFNPMVDTCPGCPASSPQTARNEVEVRRYRHVETSRWAVHHLLACHYLPYWPNNVDRVFATIDIATGEAVAAAVFAFPVLRCHLREQVFGRVDPDYLNRDFRQLVRWMVRPDHRGSGIGSELLAWSFARMQTPVIEAINRSWVPVKPFLALGMVKRSDGNRHYYFRLKDCRKRVDEIAAPKGQTPIIPATPGKPYPRIWKRDQTPPHTRLLFVEAWEGAKICAYHWAKEYLTRMYVTSSVADMEAHTGLHEVVDLMEREQLIAEMQAGLPVMSSPAPYQSN